MKIHIQRSSSHLARSSYTIFHGYRKFSPLYTSFFPILSLSNRRISFGVMDKGFGFQVNMHGVLSSNAFFNFVNHYKTQNNLESKPMSELTKEAAPLWSAMTAEEKMPFKRTATAVKNFKASKQKKIVGPYKIIGYQSDLALGKNNKPKMKEMIAYSQSLKLNLKRSPDVVSDDSEKSETTYRDYGKHDTKHSRIDEIFSHARRIENYLFTT